MHFTTPRNSNGSVLYADELVFWRVRLGYSTSRVVLPTAGSAAMRHSPQVAWWLSPQTTVFNTIRAGWTFGGGLEAPSEMVGRRSSSYLYMDLGSFTNTFVGLDHLIRSRCRYTSLTTLSVSRWTIDSSDRPEALATRRRSLLRCTSVANGT